MTDHLRGWKKAPRSAVVERKEWGFKQKTKPSFLSLLCLLFWGFVEGLAWDYLDS